MCTDEDRPKSSNVQLRCRDILTIQNPTVSVTVLDLVPKCRPSPLTKYPSDPAFTFTDVLIDVSHHFIFVLECRDINVCQ